MPEPTVESLSSIEQKLTPADPLARSKWLFENGTTYAFGNSETPFEEREQMHTEIQAKAVREVYEKLGLEGLFKLGSNSQFHLCTKIGDCLAKSGLLPDWEKILPEKLLSKTDCERGIALGYHDPSLENSNWMPRL